MADYLIGTSITLTATFRDVNGDLADPGQVKFKLLLPDGSALTYSYPPAGNEVVKDSTGVYHVVYEPDAPGPFYWRVEGIGTVDTAAEDTFTMDAGAFA